MTFTDNIRVKILISTVDKCGSQNVGESQMPNLLQSFQILSTGADRRTNNNRRGWFIQGLHKERKNS